MAALGRAIAFTATSTAFATGAFLFVTGADLLTDFFSGAIAFFVSGLAMAVFAAGGFFGAGVFGATAFVAFEAALTTGVLPFDWCGVFFVVVALGTDFLATVLISAGALVFFMMRRLAQFVWVSVCVFDALGLRLTSLKTALPMNLPVAGG